MDSTDEFSQILNIIAEKMKTKLISSKMNPAGNQTNRLHALLHVSDKV